MVRLKRRPLLTLTLIFFLTLLFYGFISRLYFTQDDFFHLRVSQTDGSFKEFLNLFSFEPFSERGGIYFYRPIFREGLFHLFFRTFGLNPLPFRLLQLTIHFINVILVYKLVKLLTKNERVSYAASLFFAVSAANVGVLSYLAGGIQASGMTMFLLLSTTLFLKEKRTYAFLFFILGLASHELAFVYPIILGGLMAVRQKLGKIFFVQLTRQLWPYLVTVAAFLFLEVKIIGLPLSEMQYGISFSVARVVNSFAWYSVWSLGIPEMLLDFVGPGLNLNPNLMNFWGNYFAVIFSLFAIIILIIFITTIKIIKKKELCFFIFWFFIGLSPVVLLPLHRSTYYLAFSLVPVAGAVGLIFDYLSKKKLLAYLLLGSLVALSFITVDLSKKTFWAITRAKIAKNLLTEIKKTYPSLSKGATVYFLNDPDYPVINQEWGGSAAQARVVLSGSDALRLLYRDESLKVLYEGDGLSVGEDVFPMVARIRI